MAQGTAAEPFDCQHCGALLKEIALLDGTGLGFLKLAATADTGSLAAAKGVAAEVEFWAVAAKLLDLCELRQKFSRISRSSHF
jgi:hypothetical protein